VVFVNTLNLSGAALTMVILILIKGLHNQTWPGWSFACLQGWRSYLKLAIPGTAMLTAEW
jgi:hypothetical protein